MVVGVWQGVAMDFLKFHLGPPCLTLLPPAGVPPLKRPYGRFRGAKPTERVACGRLLPLWTPQAVFLICHKSTLFFNSLCFQINQMVGFFCVCACYLSSFFLQDFKINEKVVSFLVFLTDGQPTIGEVNLNTIIS
jgi:hypothetical protein